MMQVDRNDIWVNLQQIERGVVSGNVGKASRVASRVPYNTFSFFDDPTESEIEKSRSNEANLNQIRREINRSENVLQQKMDDLWGIYNTKVKPFENTDDDYYGKAQKLKMSYTGLFEGVWDGVEDLSSDIYGFGKGLVLGLYEIGKGIVTVAGDAGIVYTSHQLPDSVEPDFLKEAADKRVEGYRAAAMQTIKDPMGVAESITQSFSDTYEDEGIAYLAGNASTAFIPYVGMAGKSASLAKVAGKIPNSNLSKVAGSSKVDVAAIVKKHNAFVGIKRGMGEFVQDVKGGMQVAGNSNRVAVGANGVAGNGVASVSKRGVSNHVVDDSIVRIKTEVDGVDTGKGSKGTGEAVNLWRKSICNTDELYNYLLKNVNIDVANKFLKEGKWPEGIQIQKNSSVLNRDGSINWSKAAEGGYTLNVDGTAIKEQFTPEIREVIDRYGNAKVGIHLL